MRRPSSFTEMRRRALAQRLANLDALEPRSMITESLGIFAAGIGLAAAGMPRHAPAAEVAATPVAGKAREGDPVPAQARGRAAGGEVRIGALDVPLASTRPVDPPSARSRSAEPVDGATDFAAMAMMAPPGGGAAAPPIGAPDVALASPGRQGDSARTADEIGATAATPALLAALAAPGPVGSGATEAAASSPAGTGSMALAGFGLGGPGGGVVALSTPASGAFDHFPLYTLDYNHGTVLFPGAAQIGVPGEAVDLRAQVRLPSGATTATYSWNTSGLAHATSISGSSSARLQFTWDASPSFGAADFLTDTATLTVTSGGNNEIQTYTFILPKVRANAAGSAPTWADTLAPGLVAPNAPTFADQNVSVGTATGSVGTAVALPAYSPNIAPLTFRYDSLAADPRPIVLARHALSGSVPSTVVADLTFNGSAAATITYDTSDLLAGDILQAALQADATGLATGRYAYSVGVTVSGSTTTYSGTTSVVNGSANPIGAGWSLDGFQSLVVVSGSGVLLDAGGGSALWFAGAGPSFTSPAGEFSTLVRNGGGDYTRTLPDGTVQSFSSAGKQTAVADRNGLAVSYAYDGSGRLSTITDPYAKVTTFAYDGSGKLATVTDPASRVATFTHSGSNLTGVALPGGLASWAYGYDGAGRLTTVTDPVAKATTVAYDSAHRAATIARPDATVTTYSAAQVAGFAPAGAGTVPAVLLAEAAATAADPYGALTSVRPDWYGFGLAGQTIDPLEAVATIDRSVAGLALVAVDPVNRLGQAAYDSAGNPTTMVHGDLATEKATYNGFGEVTVAVDELGHTTTSTYDVKGNRTSVEDPLNHRTTYTYTANGRLATAKNANSHTTSYAYDSQDRLTTVVAPLGDTTRYAYDSYGNRSTATDPNGHTTSTTYDALNRPTVTVDALNNRTTYGYDAASHRTTATDPLGKVTTTAYNAMGRVARVTDPEGGIATYTYDDAGRTLAVIDPVGNATTYTYDDAGHKVAETDPRGHDTTYAYDAAGQLVDTTDRDGRRTTFAYDLRGRQIAERWLDGGGSTLRTITTAYDAAGRVTSVADPDATITYTYDNAGRLTGTTSTPASGPALTLSYGYDNAGNRTSMADSLSGRATTTYEYDAKERLTTLTRDFGATKYPLVQYQYDAANRLLGMDRTLGKTNPFDVSLVAAIATDYTYDNADHLLGVDNTVDNGLDTPHTDAYAYSPDATGRVASASDPSGTLTYTYDDTGQLKGVTGYRLETYTYDDAGNRTMASYSTSAGNQLDASPYATYTYDNEGNRTAMRDSSTGATTTFAYDYRNRLTGITRKNSGGSVILTESFAYDPLGRRIKAVVDADGAGAGAAVTRWTAYDGPNAYADFDGSNALTMRYLYGPAVDALLGRTDSSGNSAWYLADKIGSVQKVVSSTGSTVSVVTYDSYGNVLSESGSGGDRFKYTGREFDANSGLYDYRRRAYDPKIGKFIQQDPIGFESTSLNLFSYTGNDPINNRDPSGTDRESTISLNKIIDIEKKRIESDIEELEQNLEETRFNVRTLNEIVEGIPKEIQIILSVGPPTEENQRIIEELKNSRVNIYMPARRDQRDRLSVYGDLMLNLLEDLKNPFSGPIREIPPTLPAPGPPPLGKLPRR